MYLYEAGGSEVGSSGTLNFKSVSDTKLSINSLLSLMIVVLVFVFGFFVVGGGVVVVVISLVGSLR